MYFGGYGLYLLISLPALLLGLYAQAKVKGAFNKYSQVRTSNGMTGAEVARKILTQITFRKFVSNKSVVH